MSEEDRKLMYVKEKNVHHLFELLASKVLADQPDDLFAYLRGLINEVEEEEANAHKYDPSQLLPKGSMHKGLSPQKDSKPNKVLKVTLAVFGLDNAGKTALISAMGGEVDKNTTSTIGFSPTQFQTDRFDICMFDLGGGVNFRGIWPHYYHDCHAVIYVVDAADPNRLEESSRVFKEVVQHKYIHGKPVLIFANKKDLPTFVDPTDIDKKILCLDSVLDPSSKRKTLACCALEEDPSVDEGVEWILTTVERDYDRLSSMVMRDTLEVKEEKKRRLAEQAKRVEELKREDAARVAAGK